MKIFYDKQTKEFAGAVNISSEHKNKKSELGIIEVSKEEWLEFLSKNQGRKIKITNKHLDSETIELTIEEKKSQRISIRKQYLKDSFERWFDDVENMPQDIKENRVLARNEIDEIKNATEETINNYLTTFED